MTEPTDSQRQAIEYDSGNLLIVACAGSGKTETISRRIVRFVSSGGVRKDAIIAFTFTDHAANELKARIRRHLEEDMPDEPSLGDMYVGTIHSFCLRLLRELAPEYRNYEVMDEVRQAALIATNFTRFDDSGRGLGLDRLRARTRTGTYWETVRCFTSTLNILHQKGIEKSQLRDDRLRESVERYENLAYGSPNYFFDFDHIIDVLLKRLKEDPAELSKVRSMFSHVVVDEYQDVDDRQEELISLLSDSGSAMNVTAVGDDDQALYGFRGASVRNILTFEQRYPNVRRVNMKENFRCTHAIVEIADQSIRKVHQRLTKDMVARRRDPQTGKLSERLADPGDIQLCTFASEEDEANWVADRIEALRGVIFVEKDGTERPLDYADMSVLLRSVRSSGTSFARSLRDRGIPVVVSGTRGLFNNEEIRLVQATFCLLARADFGFPDEDGHFRILNTADTREFIRGTIERLSARQMPTASPTKFLGWVASKLEELDRRSLRPEERGKLARRIYPQDIFQEMLSELGSQEQDWTTDVLFNFGAFSKLLAEFEAVHQWVTPSALKGLCLFLGNWAAGNADEGGVDEVVRLNSVQIMTVHAAKGLEWPVVFLPRISSANFPSSRRNHGPETFLSAEMFDAKEYAGGDDGERRLWYVALTRCAKFLNISSLDRPRKKPTEYFKEVHHEIVRRGTDPTIRTRGDPRPPDDAVMLPTTFSDLTYWWRCPREYQLRSLMGFSPGVGEQYGYGKQLHNILAELHERAGAGSLPTTEEIEELVDKRFHLRYTRGKPFEALKLAAKRALLRYVRENRESLSRTHAVEKPFEFIDKKSEALITGVVDLLERVEGAQSNDPHREVIGIVDFKAHRITSVDSFDELRCQAERQLRLYAHAVTYAFPYVPAKATAQLITPYPPDASLSAKGVVEQIEVDVSEARVSEALDEVRNAVAEIKTNLRSQCFPRLGPKGSRCPVCDFRAFCPGYVEWRKLDKSAPTPLPPGQQREGEVDEIIGEYDAWPPTQ